MRKLTVREFRAKVSHYIRVMQGGEELEVNGIRIGARGVVTTGCEAEYSEVVENAFFSEERQAKIDKLREVTEMIMKGKMDVEAKIVEPVYRCQKCGKRSVEVYEFFEDGEERVVCGRCIKRVDPNGKYKKIEYGEI